MDLPCIIECQKTYNKSLYFKTGDISQLLVVESNHKDSTNPTTTDDTQYVLDSGLTPPASEIRTRWSHRRPICQHDDAEVDHLCSKCHNIPRGLIKKISTELYNRMHGNPSETWELITTEEWIEVTDDEESESEPEQKTETEIKSDAVNPLNAVTDNTNKVQDPPRDEWEVESDDDITMNSNSNSNTNSNPRSNPKRENTGSQQRRGPLDRPQSAGRGSMEKSKSQRPASMSKVDGTNSAKRPTSSLRVPSITRMGPLERPPSIKRNSIGSVGSQSSSAVAGVRSLSRPPSSTQPPLPSLRTTPRRTTPMSNTPMMPGMGSSLRNKVIKVNTDSQQNKKKREKKALEDALKAKQEELKVKEEEVKTQKNRKIKKNAMKKRDALKKEIAEIEAKLKAL